MLNPARLRAKWEKAALRVFLGRQERLSPPPAVILLGPESAGKTALLDAVTGRRTRQQAMAGSTVSVERADVHGEDWVDTPGLLHEGATDAARRTLDALNAGPDAVVLLVVPIIDVAACLPALLPTIRGRRIAVAATFVDETDPSTARRILSGLARRGGVPVVGINAAAPTGTALTALFSAVEKATAWDHAQSPVLIGLPVLAPPRALSVFDHKLIGPALGLLTLLAPAALATWAGLHVSALVEAACEPWLSRLPAATQTMPPLLRDVLTGQYGMLSMLPLLFVWALPIMMLHAVAAAVTKASGLLDRASMAVEPWCRPFGLTGRDVSRVIMGYGCNVPAVVQGRSCLSCTRESCSAAIAFGSACSYQLGAVLGVLSAGGHGALVVPYLLVISAGALVCARWSAATSTPPGRLLVARTRLRRPSMAQIRLELRGPLQQVLFRVIPVFLAITVVTSLLDAIGALHILGLALGPLLLVTGLPAVLAPAIAAAAFRKDGILLMAAPAVLTTLGPATTLAGLVLASTLTPCAVTALTLAREHGTATALRTIARGALVSIALTAAIAWTGTALG